jgi:hypothetical protein
MPLLRVSHRESRSATRRCARLEDIPTCYPVQPPIELCCPTPSDSSRRLRASWGMLDIPEAGGGCSLSSPRLRACSTALASSTAILISSSAASIHFFAEHYVCAPQHRRDREGARAPQALPQATRRSSGPKHCSQHFRHFLLNDTSIVIQGTRL